MKSYLTNRKALIILLKISIYLIICVFLIYSISNLTSNKNKSQFLFTALNNNLVGKECFDSNSIECQNKYFNSVTTAVKYSLANTIIPAVLVFGIFTISFGMLLQFSRNIVYWMEGLVSGLRGVPSIAWLPILVSIELYMTKFSQTGFVIIGIIPLVCSHIIHSLLKVQDEQIQIPKNIGASRIKILFQIIIPATITDLIQSLRYGLSLSFVLVLVYEWIWPSNFGIGRIISPTMTESFLFSDAIIFVFLVGLIGFSLDRLGKSILFLFHHAQRIRAQKVYSDL